MLFLLIISIFIFLAFYCTILLWLGAGFRRLSDNRLGYTEKAQTNSLPTISVIVAARNEARSLPRLIHCLQQQDYPSNKIEFCIVDDRSDDGSWEILRQAEKRYENFRMMRIDDALPDYAPKKRALDHAMRAAHGEILLLTDADCTPPPTWARSIAQHYSEGIVMVPGYSPYRFDYPAPAIVKGMLALDYFALAAVAAAAIGQGCPLTAAGCNFSYRRKTYFQAGGFAPIRKWVSGDDDLFLLSVAQQKLGRFAYALAPESFVPCAAPTSMKQFWHQRIRYASKGLHYSLPMTASLLAVYLLNVSLVLSAPALVFGFFDYTAMALLVWVVKSFFEYRFLAKSISLFREKSLLRYFLPTALAHPFYITLFAFLGAFSRFRWKDDKTPKKHKSEPASHD
ncbi:MAG: glycosyltransferase [bacterium]